ncbi:MAG: hypothetical protein JOZ99_07610 [Actinobacteria bacterium]|nr:hypothetical protein [Actinomycetota bacterium]
MRLDRSAILKYLHEHDGNRVDQAERELPQDLDHEEHGDLLSKLGLDPSDMLRRFEAKHTGPSQSTSAESPMPVALPDAPPPEGRAGAS